MKEVVLAVELFFLIIALSLVVYNWFYLVQIKKVQMKLGIFMPGIIKNMVAVNLFLPLATTLAILFFIFLTISG